ncbi:MAG TPA: peptidylprolyl isomerase, partial [Gemmataceae bacterium]|nr:peptidylprolyl isomerase [Gemmataceae bacterium]
CQTPAMDGDYTVFGKVTQGLDIARRILSLPLSNEAPEGDRPARPVVIRKVIIEASEVEN